VIAIVLYLTRSKVTLTRSVSEGSKSQSFADAAGYDPVLTPASFSAARSILGLLIVSQQKSRPLIVSGFVEADEIRVGSRVAGRVLKFLFEEGTGVRTGATLVELEPFDLLERKAEAQQFLAQTSAAMKTANLLGLRMSIGTAKPMAQNRPIVPARVEVRPGAQRVERC